MPRQSSKTKHAAAEVNTRQHAWTGLYRFANEVLGYKDMMPQPHHEMCDWLDDLVQPVVKYTAATRKHQRQTKGMMLVPRGCFKTTIGTVSMALHVLERNPNARILIDTHTHDFAMQILREIKYHLENNETFIRLFGDWKEGSTLWARENITIGPRTEALKEPSIDTAGVDKSKNGGHYDLIIADDLHEERNTANEEQRKKVRSHIQMLYPILEPGGVLLITGTRWHNADAYGWLLAKNREAEKKNQAPPYRTLLRSSFLDDGTLYFPTKIDDEFLAQQRLELDDKLFAVWYLNKPIEDGSKYFPLALIKYYDGNHFVDSGQAFLELAAAA